MALHALAYCERPMFVHLCPGCAERIHHRGNEKDWKPPEKRHEIV
ncbi:MAG TPA: hypothetical protein VM534_02695 [Thermoanaerobaculia bacterium]|nr:hypothetical protein [Thermoanaerobaculia bacterium]